MNDLVKLKSNKIKRKGKIKQLKNRKFGSIINDYSDVSNFDFEI